MRYNKGLLNNMLLNNMLSFFSKLCWKTNEKNSVLEELRERNLEVIQDEISAELPNQGKFANFAKIRLQVPD